MANYRPILHALQLETNGAALPTPTDIALKWPYYHLCFEPAIGTDTPVHRRLLASPWSLGECRQGTYTSAHGQSKGYSIYLYRIPPEVQAIKLEQPPHRHHVDPGLSHWTLEKDGDSDTFSLASSDSLRSLSTSTDDMIESEANSFASNDRLLRRRESPTDYAMSSVETSRPIDIPQEYIAIAAYYLAEQSGFQRDQDDCWFAAIRQLEEH